MWLSVTRKREESRDLRRVQLEWTPTIHDHWWFEETFWQSWLTSMTWSITAVAAVTNLGDTHFGDTRTTVYNDGAVASDKNSYKNIAPHDSDTMIVTKHPSSSFCQTNKHFKKSCLSQLSQLNK